MSKLKIKDGDEWIEVPAGGVGVPAGGSAGDVLVKSSGTNYATEWGKLGINLLWTNPNPNTAFAAQTIQLDLSYYNFILIEFYTMTTAVASGGAYISDFATIDGQKHMIKSGNGATSGAWGFGTRAYTPSSTGIVFDAALSQSSWAVSGTENNFNVPYKIYGVKL